MDFGISPGHPGASSIGPPARFTATALLLMAAGLALPDALVDPVNRISAATAVQLLRLLGWAPWLDGTLIQLGNFRAEVISECTILFPALLLAAFFLAAPGPPSHRALGIALGLPALFSLNTARLAGVIAVGAELPQMFTVLHTFCGQIFMVLAVYLPALLWLKGTADGGLRLGGIPFGVRVAFWCLLLFPLWLCMNRLYVAAGDRPLGWMFNLLGLPLDLQADLPIYYQTFNVVTFCALMLASRTSRQIRTMAMFKGLMILWLGHQAFRLCNVLLTAYGLESAFHASVLVHLVGQYLLPATLWFLLARPAGFGSDPAGS